MNRSLVWGASLIILLGAAVLAGRASQAPNPAKAPAVAAADPALARCRTAEAGDLACRAAWDAARAHFFGRPAS